MTNFNSQTPTGKAKEQTVQTLATYRKGVKGGTYISVHMNPQYVTPERKYGHVVKIVGKKRIEVTPLSEIEPVDISFIKQMSEKYSRHRKKKNSIDLIKKSLRMYVDKIKGK